MKKFFDGLLNEFTTPAFLRAVLKKYHYGEEQLQELADVAEKMMPYVRSEACWDHGLLYEAGLADGGEEQQYNCAEVLMTLGKGPDILQERFAVRGRLSECYMVESLASELLLRGYAAYNQYIAEHTALHVARYHFPGSGQEFPLERLKGMLERLALPVKCNEAFCMIPKKSVAFVAELTGDAARSCQGICTGCDSRSCPNRMEEGPQLGRMAARMPDVPLSYGYSRIFGRF